MPNEIKTLSFFMIANKIDGLLNRISTPSQVINGVMLRGKKLIRHLNIFSVVCLYETDLRFRCSAVIASGNLYTRQLMVNVLASNHKKWQRYFLPEQLILYSILALGLILKKNKFCFPKAECKKL